MSGMRGDFEAENNNSLFMVDTPFFLSLNAQQLNLSRFGIKFRCLIYLRLNIYCNKLKNIHKYKIFYVTNAF